MNSLYTFTCKSLLALILFSSATDADESVEFLPPLSPQGQEIRDHVLLTSQAKRDEIDTHRAGTDQIESKLPAETTSLLKQKQMRFQRLKSQLLLLSDAWLRVKETAEQKASPRENSATEVDQQSTLAEKPELVEPVPQTKDLDQLATTENAPQPIPKASGTDHSLSFQNTSDIPGMPPVPSPLPMLEAEEGQKIEHPESVHSDLGAIDRYALATSLYAEQHFPECLRTIDSITLGELSEYEMAWLSYLKAGCLRQAGQLDESQRIYRRLVASPEQNWISETARWWLDQMQEMEQLNSDQQILSTAIKQWKQAVDELTR